MRREALLLLVIALIASPRAAAEEAAEAPETPRLLTVDDYFSLVDYWVRSLAREFSRG